MLSFRDIVASVPSLNEAEHYAQHFARKAANGPRLKPLGKPCRDCAVICDFYAEISDRLSMQPEPIRTEAALRWHCHNHPNRACRGNLDRLAAPQEPRHGEG